MSTSKVIAITLALLVCLASLAAVRIGGGSAEVEPSAMWGTGFEVRDPEWPCYGGRCRKSSIRVELWDERLVLAELRALDASIEALCESVAAMVQLGAERRVTVAAFAKSVDVLTSQIAKMPMAD